MDYSDQFKAYYEQYQDMVRTLCLGYSKGNQPEADDLTQEVFMKIWGALPSFKRASSPKTWIYRICVNTCLLNIRKQKRRDLQALPENHTEVKEEEKKDHHFTELYQAIGQLKEIDRIVIMLVLEEVSYPEIAEIVGTSEGNLRVKISRIKQRLNKILSKNG